jgi:branched-chain amino acid transport system substrate-binding protein
MVQSVTIPAGVVSISDSATAPSISDLKDNDLVFRTAPSDAYQGAALAKLAHDAGFKALAVTYSNDDYNAGIAKVFAESFAGMGGTVTATQVHEPNKASYRSEIATLSGNGAEGLALFAYYGGSGITIIRNSLETGAFGKFMAADGMFDVSVIEQIGAENLKDNLMITQAASDPENASYQLFAAEFAKTGMDPAAPYASHGYDATFLIALAIEKAGGASSMLCTTPRRRFKSPPTSPKLACGVTTATFTIGSSSLGPALRTPSLNAAAPATLNGTAPDSRLRCTPPSSVTLTSTTG